MKPGDLDDKFLPLAAAKVAALTQKLAVQRTRFRHSFQGTSLKDLDARYAGTGPLALLRDVPQVGFVLIAAVFLAGAGTVVTRESSRNRTAQQQTVDPGSPETPYATGDTTLGPEVGEATATYEGTSARGLTEASTGSPEDTRVALISLRAYQSPAQLKVLLEGFPVRRVFLRAKAAGTDASQIPIDIKGDLLTELRRAYAATVSGRLEAQKSYQGYVDSLTVTTPEEQAFKDLYAAFAKATGIEAREFKAGCACVFAVVVEAKAGRLQDLRTRPGIRAIEVADRGVALRALQVRPLLPEVRGAVPKQQAGVDSKP